MSVDRRIVRAQMQRAKSAILSVVSDDGFKDLIDKDRDTFAGLRILYASDEAGVPLQSEMSNDGCVRSIFAGKGLLAIFDAIDSGVQLSDAPIIFSRPLIDTNLFSDLPQLLAGKDFSTRDRVEETLRYITSKFGPDSLDWTFASLENMREAEKIGNPWPIRKAAAARHYLSDKRNELRSLDQLDEFSTLAKAQWKDWLMSAEMWRQVRRRDVVYMVMLLAFMEAWHGRTVIGSLRQMMTFCVDYFGTVPLKELYFGWKLLRGIHQPKFALEIFSETPLRQPHENSLARINAAAWDLFIFRWCETQMSERMQLDPRLNAFVFYVPVVTTLDGGLLNAIKSCPLKAVLVHDEAKIVESIFADELEFQIALNDAMTPYIRDRITDPKRRATSGYIDSSVQDMAMKILEKQVKSMTDLGVK